MVKEVTGLLLTDPEGNYLDATIGLGGHSEDLLRASEGRARVTGVDRDPKALEKAGERLSAYGDRVRLIHGNFRDVESLVGGELFDGILIDLGLSSLQIADRERGFSYMEDGPLDMSMGRGGRPVAELLEKGSEKEIADVIYRYGEEKRSRRIARAIVMARKEGGIAGTSRLRSVIEAAVPSRGIITTLSRVFQALRIWANDELENLRAFLPQAVALLTPRGRLAVLSYHSLEDRIVKEYFRREEKGCICPADFPQCTCGREPVLKVITKRPQRPTAREIEDNTRSRSARLRVAERLA